MSTARPKQLTELKVTCTSTDCGNDLHCFLQKKAEAGPHGPCRECGADLVDWPRLHARDMNDVRHTFDALQRERIRHHCFHHEFTKRAFNYAKRAGYKKLDERAHHQVRKSIGPAEPFRDGYQTKLHSDNPIDDARHATATCCRRCFEYWYGVPKGRDLTDPEIDFAAKLVMAFLRLRLPDLTDEPQFVPHVRKGR